MFDRTVFRNGKPTQVGHDKFETSVTAHLSCGEVNATDVIGLTNGRVGRVTKFWQAEGKNGTTVVEFELYSRVDHTRWCTAHCATSFANASDIVAPLTWAQEPLSHIRVILSIGFFL